VDMETERNRAEETRPAGPSPRRILTFSTCPESGGIALDRYPDLVRAAARSSEAQGCFGMLIYSENRLVDPWLVAQLVIEATDHLVPLVAVQPAYSHPYTVAKLISTLTNMYGRQLYVNLVAGGFRNDLIALGDSTEHDHRYVRVGEFGEIVTGLCRGEALTMAGNFYSVTGLRLTPPVPSTLQPGFMVSGSSPTGRGIAAALNATAVRYPLPPGDGDQAPGSDRSGIRVGIIARADRDEAWRVAHATFPPDRAGEVAYGFAMKVTDSHWHQQLSSADTSAVGASPYWLHPFRRYQTFCPYLVGSYSEVAGELTRYFDEGADVVILDVPPRAEELTHGLRCVELASS
jgi:alkanesulfonate monooxygenase